MHQLYAEIILRTVITCLCLYAGGHIYYLTRKMSRKRHCNIMQKRYIILSQLSCTLCCMSVLIRGLLSPELLMVQYVAGTIDSNMRSSILDLFHYSFTYGILYTLVIRIFWLYFDYNWAADTISSHWLLHISKSTPPTVVRTSNEEPAEENVPLANFDSASLDFISNSQHCEEEHSSQLNIFNIFQRVTPIYPSLQVSIEAKKEFMNSWFINNRSKFYSFPMKSSQVLIAITIVLFSALLDLIVTITALYTTNKLWIIISKITRFFLLSIPLFIILYLWWKTQKIGPDALGIRIEINALIATLVISLFVEVSSMIPKIVLRNPYLMQIEILYEIYFLFFNMFIVLCQTEWVIYFIKKREKLLNCSLFDETIEQNNYSNPFVEDTTLHNYQRSNVVLSTIFECDELLMEFVKYLACAELSIEYLLAFIEFEQFQSLLEKDYFKPKNLMNDFLHDTCTHTDPDEMVLLSVPIPQSSIVYNHTYTSLGSQYRFQNIAQKLCAKYIQRNSEFDLCIYQQTKRRILRCISENCSRISEKDNGGIKHSGLDEMFEECKKKLFWVLTNVCHRFVYDLTIEVKNLILETLGDDNLTNIVLSYLAVAHLKL